MTNTSEMWNYCRDLIDHSGIYRCAPGKTLPAKRAGHEYEWQYYLRRCLYDQAFANYVANLFWNRFDNTPGFQLAACEAAGVPLACAIQAVGLSRGRSVSMFTIKQTPKAYGLMNMTEGPITNEPVMLIDDLAGSQSTLLTAKRLLEARGLKLHSHYFCLVDKAGGSVKANRVYLGDLELYTLFNSNNFAMSWDAYVVRYGQPPVFGDYF